MIRLGWAHTRPTGNKRRGLPLRALTAPMAVVVNGVIFLVIPTGYVSDGASIPWFLRWKWPSWGRYAGPSILHDYLLEHSPLPKWEIDWLFMGSLRAEGVPALEAGLFWLAVRARKKAP